jgi:hypothetical protein
MAQLPRLRPAEGISGEVRTDLGHARALWVLTGKSPGGANAEARPTVQESVP